MEFKTYKIESKTLGVLECTEPVFAKKGKYKRHPLPCSYIKSLTGEVYAKYNKEKGSMDPLTKEDVKFLVKYDVPVEVNLKKKFDLHPQ